MLEFGATENQRNIGRGPARIGPSKMPDLAQVARESA
jgi:hypothetical protein